MAIVVEDGTGKADSESYISVADASAYFTARGNTTWGAITTDALREAALRKATDYMTAIYRTRWQGWRTTPTVQALCWPRSGVTIERVYVDNQSVPTAIKNACAELALKAASADLLVDVSPAVLSETVGSISVTYDRSAAKQTQYAAIDGILLPYLKSGGGVSIGLVRT